MRERARVRVRVRGRVREDEGKGEGEGKLTLFCVRRHSTEPAWLGLGWWVG